MYRQGDMLLIPVAQLPKAARQLDGPVRLYRSAASVYAPSLSGDDYQAYMAGGEVHLTVTGSVTVTHPEHAPLTVPPGVYLVVQQREYPEHAQPITFTMSVSE
jgi:hypothetical protein